MKQRLGAWWATVAPREKRLVLVAGAVLVAYLVFALAIQPAWRTLRAAPAQLDALDGQLQTVQRLAAEVGELRATPPVNPSQAEAALKSATARLGDKARLTMQGDRAVLTLTGAGTEALRGWLAEVRSAARARPLEATLSRAANGYSGTIIVAVGAPAS